MLIRLGYDIQFDVPVPTPIVALLNVHPSRTKDLLEPDLVRVSPEVPQEVYVDSFGNTCCRVVAPPGRFQFSNSTLIRDSGEPDPSSPDARQLPIEELPTDILRFLLASRYCEVDLLSNVAMDLFGNTTPGWERVRAICTWVNQHVYFGYSFARSTKTALDVYLERQGVCRDFQHLAITFCRCMNIPARYTTGYLGDIGVPPSVSPMDFSAWFEVYLGDRWWTCDARHNVSRIGRVLMATGRDAADVAITTSFGGTTLRKFEVTTYEVNEQTTPVPSGTPETAIPASH